MLSLFIKELLKAKFPLLNYYLFYSEAIAILLLVGVTVATPDYGSDPLLVWMLIPAGIAYFALCIVGAASFRRKRREKVGQDWRASPFEFICAVIMCMGLVAAAYPFYQLAAFAWSEAEGELFSEDGIGAGVIGALAVAGPIFGISSLYTLIKGRWVLFP